MYEKLEELVEFYGEAKSYVELGASEWVTPDLVKGCVEVIVRTGQARIDVGSGDDAADLVVVAKEDLNDVGTIIIYKKGGCVALIVEKDVVFRREREKEEKSPINIFNLSEQGKEGGREEEKQPAT